MKIRPLMAFALGVCLVACVTVNVYFTAASGEVGMSATGLITLRDPKLVHLQQRNKIKKIVVDENADHNRLYSEIAKANDHPEWKKDIRGIFAGRWVGNAPRGWRYESGGKCQTK